jgi:TetR/AcrR family transcriptional repressor of bet genes
MRALNAAGHDPGDHLIALIRADFDAAICNPESLAIWFSFWGEQKFTPQYAEVSALFDAPRAAAIRQACGALLGDAAERDADQIAEWIDTLSDGFWQRLHVFPGGIGSETALTETLALATRFLPCLSERLAGDA